MRHWSMWICAIVVTSLSACTFTTTIDRSDVVIPHGDVVDGPADTSGASDTVDIIPRTDAGCSPSCWGLVCGSDGCGGTCGTCPSDTVCATSGTVCIPISAQKPLGQSCGPTIQCLPQVEYAMYPGRLFPNPHWPGCLNDQCREGACLQGICSRRCEPVKDVLMSGTDLAVPDGIEDADAIGSDCITDEGTFTCVRTVNDDDVPGLCYPRASFRGCTHGADCDPGETCGFLLVLGRVESHCVRWGTAQATLGESCGVDMAMKTWTRCASGNCTDAGCTAACVTDDDCTDGGVACSVDGTCTNTGDACITHGDCLSWRCEPGLVIDSPAAIVSACAPRSCANDADCPGGAHYCRHLEFAGSSGAMPISGQCLARREGGAVTGSPCDETAGDGLPNVVCANADYCLDGFCSAMCQGDPDCGPDPALRCGLDEVEVDVDNNDRVDGYLSVARCMQIGDAASDCAAASDCDTDVCTPFVPWNGLAAWNGTAVRVETRCMPPPAGSIGMGSPCGAAAFGATCDTRWCLEDRSREGLPGYCSQPCRDDDDCPGLLAVGARMMAWRCEGMRFDHAGTIGPDDDRLASMCRAYDAASSFADCSDDLACDAPHEMCLPSVRTGHPSTINDVRLWCVIPPAAGLIGDACDPAAQGQDCQTGLCEGLIVSRAGFCSRTCSADADCLGLGDGLAVCDLGPWMLPPSVSEPVFVPRCRLRSACVVCDSDTDCAMGYRCVNTSANPAVPDYRCAMECAASADCLGTDTFMACTEATTPGAAPGTPRPWACLPLACPYAMY